MFTTQLLILFFIGLVLIIMGLVLKSSPRLRRLLIICGAILMSLPFLLIAYLAILIFKGST